MNATSTKDNWIMMTTAYFVEGVALLFVGIIGILGNIAAIIVFSRQRVQRNFHCLMLALAVSDISYIIVSILVFSVPQFSSEYKTSAAYFYLLPWALPILQIGITGSIYCTVAITIERYFTVCHPFYRVSHSWPARNYILPIGIFTFLYNVPKFFELRTKVPDGADSMNSLEIVDYDTDDPIPVDPKAYGINPTDLRLNPYYIKIYCMWLNFLLMGLGPFVLLIVLNSLTLRKLKTMAEETTSLARNSFTNGSVASVNASKRKEIILAKVSLAIVFVFIICHSVKWIPNIYELIQVGTGRLVWPPWVETITNVSHLLTTLNSSVNFFIYFAKHHNTIIPESCRRRVRRRFSESGMFFRGSSLSVPIHDTATLNSIDDTLKPSLEQYRKRRRGTDFVELSRNKTMTVTQF